MNGLSKYYIFKIVNSFAEELTATEAAQKLDINRNTVNKYYRFIREAIASYQQLQFDYFVASTMPSRPPLFLMGWHTNLGFLSDLSNAHATYAVYADHEKVHIVKLPSDVKQLNNLPGIADIKPEILINGKKASFENARKFVSYARENLMRFYGVKIEYSELYLKELAFRYNYKDKDISKLIQRILPHHSDIFNKSIRRQAHLIS
ncbi:MAG: hypothetical protein IPI59_03565 [Sphingobacteriales bacterium]|jgi:hypothetical protein|nr:hypothetical protein [Sphingobacteriales bacterium]MBP9142360.1 hypothetical protein [Chitinophagales bacterium]MDA0197501.1 hypothetical protein [Bacteroidota bacterium]MBK6890311.1 hypothetical protein [Sphingobacteriales bacterium]MBK7526634.1 hypothetical protein [Sphingobacteriales bacterium]